MHCGNQTECNFNVIIWSGVGKKQSLKAYAYFNSLKYILPPLTMRLSKQIIMENARNILKEDRSCHKKFLFFLTFHLLSNCAIQKPPSFITG